MDLVEWLLLLPVLTNIAPENANPKVTLTWMVKNLF